MIEFLLRAFALKDEKRSGWVMRNVRDPESVADHSWGTALLCYLFGEEEQVDVFRAVRIALLHDLAEAEIGDIAARANEADRAVTLERKAELEQAAMSSLLSGIDRDEVAQLWREYEEAASVEGRFVRDMNLVDMCLQALLYELQRRYDPAEENEEFEGYEHLDEFFTTAAPRISTATGRRLYREIEERYRLAKQTDEGAEVASA